jgi:hypothetical protein
MTTIQSPGPRIQGTITTLEWEEEQALKLGTGLCAQDAFRLVSKNVICIVLSFQNHTSQSMFCGRWAYCDVDGS